MAFEVGDHVVFYDNYTFLNRPRMHGVITSVIDEYVKVKFRVRETLLLKDTIMHSPYARKGLKPTTDAIMRSIPDAVSAREARRVMLMKTGLSIRIPGPSHIIQEFITGQKRSFTRI